MRLPHRHVGVHAPSRGRPKGARGVALRRLRRASVVDRVVLHVVGELARLLEDLRDPGVRHVARNDEAARQGHARLHRVLRQLLQDVRHGLVQADLHHGVTLARLGPVRQVLRRVVLQLLAEDALLGDLREDLPVRTAGDTEADGAGGTVAGKAHHADVVRKVLAAELRSNTEVLADLQRLVLPLEVAESTAAHGTGGGQVVVVLGARELHGLEADLGGCASDHEGHVVRRAGAGAQGLQLLLDEGLELLGVQQGLGLLVEVGLVGRAAALGHEHELVPGPIDGHHVDLRREVALRVLLRKHRERRHLRIPQVALRVRIVHSTGEVLLVLTVSDDVLAALGHDDAGAGVLAAGQVALRGDDRIVQEVACGEAVVVGRLRVNHDLPQLSQVGWAQEVADLADAVLRQPPEDEGLHNQLLLRLAEGLDLLDRNAGAEVIHLLVVHSHRVRMLEHRLVLERHIGHKVLDLLPACRATAVPAAVGLLLGRSGVARHGVGTQTQKRSWRGLPCERTRVLSQNG
mmetsp:Transcript_73891/g.159828  ORF Transcript_73891/g.159828 Transcript_73891/m.159828 type:complete len:518 (+) Transcript_73891:377-1930(+)